MKLYTMDKQGWNGHTLPAIHGLLGPIITTRVWVNMRQPIYIWIIILDINVVVFVVQTAEYAVLIEEDLDIAPDLYR